MRNLFSKGLMAAAAVMMFASCSNEEGNVPAVDAKTTDVTIGVSLKGASTKVGGADVNLEGDVIATIKSPVIVPMVDGAYMNPIILKDIENNTKQYKEVRLQTNVNSFRVYGNIPTDGLDEAKVFAMPSLVREDADFGTGYKKPYDLYYYAEAVAASAPGENKFFVGNGTSQGDWETTATTTAEEVGNNNRVKIAGVKYAVGVLATGVRVDLTNPNEKMFGADKNQAYADVAPIVLKGITVSGQPGELDATFAQSGSDITVYETATRTDLKDSEGKIAFSDGKMTGDPNVYCVVAPEDADVVTVNFVFTNTTGFDFVNNAGETIANGADFYLATSVRKDADNKIFDAAKTTVLNVAVKDWGKASTTPIVTTDAEIGVVIDTTWGAGMVFDQDL